MADAIAELPIFAAEVQEEIPLVLRILFDPLGDGHKDLFLKVNAMPTFLQGLDWSISQAQKH
jgi:hypothetical protein